MNCPFALAKSDNTTLTEITLQLKWKHQFQFAGYYAAIHNGYYEDAGLKVNLIEADENNDPIENVLNGKAQFGVSTPDIVRIRANGHPVVVLATIFQHSPFVLVASKASGIKYVHDLAGKRIMLEPYAADIVAFMNDEQVSLDKCIIVPHSYSVNDLVYGNVDALSAYITDETYKLDKLGFDYNIISPAAGGIDFYGDLVFTTEDVIKSKPELVDDFLKASIKGWQYAMNHHNELIDVIYDTYSQRKTKDELRFEAKEMQKLIMPNVVEIGYTNIGRWRSIVDVYYRVGAINPDFNEEELLYTHYLNGKNDIPTRVIVLFISSIIITLALALFFYYNSHRLRTEVKRRKKIQLVLEDNEKTLSELVATKNKFFTIISHDLKGAFSSILGITEILHENDKQMSNAEKSRITGFLHNSVRDTFSLLENLLTWSRSQTGSLRFKPVSVNLIKIINENLALQTEPARNKNIELNIHNKLGNKLMVNIDPDMIHAVMRNLLSNAIKFTHEKGKIEIRIQKTHKEVIVSVIDDGIGIPKKDKDKLFKIENKRKSYGTRNESGTGLGLILCKEFIDKHQGRIWVESTEGKGSKFSFSLPL